MENVVRAIHGFVCIAYVSFSVHGANLVEFVESELDAKIHFAENLALALVSHCSCQGNIHAFFRQTIRELVKPDVRNVATIIPFLHVIVDVTVAFLSHLKLLS